MRDTTLTIILMLMFCAPQACSKRTKPDETPDANSKSQSQEKPSPTAFKYPIARWRMATFDELDRTTLWFGHIAIRHEESRPDTFRQGSWRPDSPNPKRSVNEALALAEKVASQAAADPNDFEQLARKYSEDIVSRENGGVLGGVRASQTTGSGFLDVLAVLKPGEVSKPFQSPYGFHILKRYPPPPEEQVGGERIVIQYQGVFTVDDKRMRSRDEALQLARKVADLAKKGDQDFRTLVDRYSEYVDRDRHGDMGVYSTRDPEYLPLEIHLLSQLEVGEVTGPMDSRIGFEILKRVPVQPRTEYAMTAIEIPFDFRPAEREASKAVAQKQAEEVVRALVENPERFEELQNIHCCDRIQRWTLGRGEPGLSRVLDAIPLGGIASKPHLHIGGYMVMKRLDPGALPPGKPRLTELPNPVEPNYDALMKYNSGKKIARSVRSFVEEIQTDDRFTPSAAMSIAELLGDLAAKLDLFPEPHNAVRDTVYATLAKLRSKLSADQFSRFKTVGRKWAVRQMMPPGSVD